MPWVAASGVKGLASLTVTLARRRATSGRYTVRLHFAEPESAQMASASSTCCCKARRCWRHFDIVKEAGGSYRGLVKEFSGVMVTDELEVRFTPAPGLHAAPADLRDRGGGGGVVGRRIS